MSATATKERPKAARGGRPKPQPPEVAPEREELIRSWDAETLATFIADTPGDDPELLIAVNALDALQQELGVETDPFTEETEENYPEGEVGRLQRLADDKDIEADNLIEAGDEEGAAILRIEANDFRDQATAKQAEFDAQVQDEPDANAGEEEEVGGEDPYTDEPDIAPETIEIAGVKMSYPDLGGKAPTRASLTLLGGKVTLVDGTGFKKGQRIRFEGEADVTFAGQQDERDSTTQQVTGAEQIHKAFIRDLKITEIGGKPVS